MIKDFKEYIAYRSVWMGVAIVWVMLFHLGNNEISAIKWLESTGYGGVDIFFFASGIGCYYSLSKNSNLLDFIKKRIRRIYPVYFPLVLIYLLIVNLSGEVVTKIQILGNLFIWGDLAGLPNQFNWYMGALWLFYLAVPFMVEFAIQYKSKMSSIVIMISMVYIFTFLFWNNRSAIIVFTRFPIAFIGVLMAANLDAVKFKLQHVIGLLLLTALGIIVLTCSFLHFSEYLWEYGLYWYPFVLIVPGLCYVISLIAKKVPMLAKVFSCIGKVSFELYMVHIILINVADLIIYSEKLSVSNGVLKLAVIILSFAGAFGIAGLKKIVTGCISHYDKK